MSEAKGGDLIRARAEDGSVQHFVVVGHEPDGTARALRMSPLWWWLRVISNAIAPRWRVYATGTVRGRR